MNHRARHTLPRFENLRDAFDSAPGVCDLFDDDTRQPVCATRLKAPRTVDLDSAAGAVTILCQAPLTRPAVARSRSRLQHGVAFALSVIATFAIGLAVVHASEHFHARRAAAATVPTPAAAFIAGPAEAMVSTQSTREEAAPAMGLPAFDSHAVTAAMNAAGSAAARCRDRKDPPGVVRMSVTFASSGSVTTARVEGSTYAGTKTGHCLAGVFRALRVEPFDGRPVLVHKSLILR